MFYQNNKILINKIINNELYTYVGPLNKQHEIKIKPLRQMYKYETIKIPFLKI